MAVKAFHPGLIPLVRLAPFPLIALASLVIRTPWAAGHAGLAALLFLWITADSLATSFAVAERLRQGRPPGARAMMSAIAFGLVSGVLGLTPPLRTALAAMPWAVAGVAGLVGGHVLWGTVGAWHAWRRTGDGRAAGLTRRGPENVSRLVAPNVALALTVPQVRRRFLRSARTVSTVAFAVDDPQGFIRALRARMAPVAG
ncbi:hypothetical protein UCD39_25590 [Nitrospirillum sp. BR 11752]|uniref:hypothetical protein n=1 Tax=Nitrospirillum sp. BR 11752 TaxID=3104293 RepID=UPI002E9F59AE|nr:hypothetical protein [Nitrospirillum sp. BR 11752]